MILMIHRPHCLDQCAPHAKAPPHKFASPHIPTLKLLGFTGLIGESQHIHIRALCLIITLRTLVKRLGILSKALVIIPPLLSLFCLRRPTFCHQQKKVGERGTTGRSSGQFKNAALKRRGAGTARAVIAIIKGKEKS